MCRDFLLLEESEDVSKISLMIRNQLKLETIT
jgi:hypothetical protein